MSVLKRDHVWQSNADLLELALDGNNGALAELESRGNVLDRETRVLVKRGFVNRAVGNRRFREEVEVRNGRVVRIEPEPGVDDDLPF